MKQRNIDAAVFTAYLLQGICDKYDADQWGGHIGLVQDLALHGRAIADQLRMLQDLHPDADYPGVMEYELIEPLGRWIADNAPLPADTAERFAAQWIDWVSLP